MRALVFCVLVELVTASSRIDQNQYSNDENQIRRLKFSHLPFIPKSSQNGQSRLYHGLNPQQSNAFVYTSRPIIPYLIERVGNVFKNEELMRIPLKFVKRINRLVSRKIPKMLTKYMYPNRKLRQFLTNKIIYKLQHGAAYMNEIRNLILKLLQVQGNDYFMNTKKRHETDLIKFTKHKTKAPESNQEVLHEPAGYSFKDKLNILEIENPNKQIKNVAKSKSVNNVGISGKNNQDNSKIIIKDLHVNIGGNVSNVANKSVVKNNEDNAITNVALLKPSNKINNSSKYSIETYNKDNIPIEEIKKNINFNNNQIIKSLSSQSNNSTFSTKNNTSLNHNQKYNTIHDNQKTLDNAPKNRYHVDYERDFFKKNYNDFRKKGQRENVFQYNIRKNLGYHNLHQISQVKSSTDDLKKTGYNNEPTKKIQASKDLSKKIQYNKFKEIENHTRQAENINKTGYQNIIATATQSLLTTHLNPVDIYKKKIYSDPLELEIEEISARRSPYYHSQEIIVPRKSNKTVEESSSNVNVKWELHSGTGNHEISIHKKKDGADNKSMEVKNINENSSHQISNLQSIESHLRKLIKPIEMTKTQRITIKETKTITLDNKDHEENKIKSNNIKNTNLSPENIFELFLPNENDKPNVNKVIETELETSDQIKYNNNSQKSDLMYVIVNNIYLSNNKNCKNNNLNDKSCHNLNSDLSLEKEQTKDSEKDCKQNNSTPTINNSDSHLKKAQAQYSVNSTTINENEKIKGKNIEKNSQDWKKAADETLFQNKKYQYNKSVTGYTDVKNESLHVIKRRADNEEQDYTEDTSKAMSNKDKVIANILAPEDVKRDKKLLPYWLPSDAQAVYEILLQPSKDEAVTDSLGLEMPLKEEIDKIVQLKKELGNENLEEIITLKINTVGIGKATNIIDKLIPSLYDVYLKNFITKILYRLRQILSHYEYLQQKNEIKNLDIHEIRKANSIISIFESARDLFNNPDDESLYDLLVSLLRFNKQSEEDFDEEAKVILESVSKEKIYGVLKYFLIPEQKLDDVRDFLKHQDLYPQFAYFKVLENILPNIKIIIINGLAITDDRHDDINKNEETMDKLVKILIILQKTLEEMAIPETTQRYIIEESILDIVKNLANAYIKKYEETVYIQFKRQLQDALYNNISI